MSGADVGWKSVQLAAPLVYFPVETGRFEFRTGLRKLKADADMQDARDLVFQVDRQWIDYRREKLQSRREEFGKYVCRQGLTPAHASATASWLIRKLASEHPRLFRLRSSRRFLSLQCILTDETLVFDDRMMLVDVINDGSSDKYRDALDALCCQFQEDLAVILLENGDDSIAYLHLCLPNYWAPRDKIGRDFATVHRPVPGMQKITARAASLLDMLAQDGPFERFAWGLTTDTRLNHHPHAPPAMEPTQWQGRNFDSAKPELYLRIERQVTAPVPGGRAFVFAIRTYLRDVGSLSRDECRRLLQAVTTMPDDILIYKGLEKSRDEIVSRLDEIQTTQGRDHG